MKVGEHYCELLFHRTENLVLRESTSGYARTLYLLLAVAGYISGRDQLAPLQQHWNVKPNKAATLSDAVASSDATASWPTRHAAPEAATLHDRSN
jgi:hypothetical protein